MGKQFLSLLILAASLIRSFAAPAEDQKLVDFFKNYLEERFRLQPLDATRLGDHRFDHLLDDLSPDARRAQREFTKATLKRLTKEIDYKKLSRDVQIDFAGGLQPKKHQ